jgi:hypothetical protein
MRFRLGSRSGWVKSSTAISNHNSGDGGRWGEGRLESNRVTIHFWWWLVEGSAYRSPIYLAFLPLTPKWKLAMSLVRVDST